MSSISDTQLMRAGLLSDMVVGFRAAMRGRMARDPDHVEMPQHFREDRNLPRRAEFRHGARIALIWRQLRTGAATARREDRNRQFRDQGMAYCIDQAEVRREAQALLREAIAQAEHFGRPNPHLVDEIRKSVDLDRRTWNVDEAVLYYGPDGPDGILSPMSTSELKAMGERGWTSLEAVYQAQKHPFDLRLQDAIRLAPDAAAAKAIALEHRSTRRRDWATHRVVAMIRATILRVEQDAAYRSRVLSLADRDIVEDTTEGQHHEFWGVVSGSGVNVAGQIAMLVGKRIAAQDARLLIS